MRYTTDLTDDEWNLISHCFPKPGKIGRPREHDYRELLNGIFYLTKTECQWRNLPKEFAPWPIFYSLKNWIIDMQRLTHGRFGLGTTFRSRPLVRQSCLFA